MVFDCSFDSHSLSWRYVERVWFLGQNLQITNRRMIHFLLNGVYACIFFGDFLNRKNNTSFGDITIFYLLIKKFSRGSLFWSTVREAWNVSTCFWWQYNDVSSIYYDSSRNWWGKIYRLMDYLSVESSGFAVWILTLVSIFSLSETIRFYPTLIDTAWNFPLVLFIPRPVNLQKPFKALSTKCHYSEVICACSDAVLLKLYPHILFLIGLSLSNTRFNWLKLLCFKNAVNKLYCQIFRWVKLFVPSFS